MNAAKRKALAGSKPLRAIQIMGKHTTGGIKTVIMNYYEHIDRNEVQFDFIVDKNSPIKNYSDIESLGGKVYEVTSLKNPFAYLHQCRRIFRKNDYLVVHGYVNTLNVFPMFAAFLAGVPVRISENLSTGHPGEKKTIVKNILRRFSRIFPTHIAANSVYSGEWMYKKKHMDKCRIIRNGIDLDKFSYNPTLREKIRNEYGWQDKFVVGHIGRYQYQKNHNFLIDVFEQVHKKCPEAILALIGYGDLKEEIFAKIEKLGLTDFVVDLGGREDIALFYNAMNCFVLPSFYEGLPVVGIEAQATGLPCIMSDEITHETEITDNVSFIGLDKSADVWADAVLRHRTFERKDVSAQVTQNGYNIVTEAAALQQYYSDCLNGI